MNQPRALVEALAAAGPRFSPEDRKEKLRLLDELARCQIQEPAALHRFHETLCFLRAYPDDPAILSRVDRSLAGFAARVERLPATARQELHDSGIAGTTLDYPFGFPMTRWLAMRFPKDVEVAWRKFEGAERIDEALSFLVAHAEDDALSEGGLGWREWLRVAKGGRRLTALQLLLELVEQAGLSEETRAWLVESLELPIQWRLRGASRTLAKLPWPRPFFHRDGVRRAGFSFVREVERALPSIRQAPRALAEALIESARAAMATRLRELHAFSHPNPDDVLVAEPGRGLRIALIGLSPKYRLPLEGYYAFYVLKNGVPVSYGGGWELFGTLELGLNIFESFRQGESAYIFSQVLRVYRRALAMRTVVMDPYQLGRDNPEALRSGAFYFYHRLGFRPRDRAVLRLSERERARIARTPGYRTPIPIMKRLAEAEMYLTLPGGSREPEKRLRASQVSALVTRHIAREYGGDRRAAVRAAVARVSRALGVPRWRTWGEEERRQFERMALVVALIPNLERWPAAERRHLVRMLRAKGGRSERPYVRLLQAHRRFRLSLKALVEANG
ncbi:MAG: hypothetical protein HYV92_06040 [Candidatus Rokubacteria bacterium]|nr:hypothetical protein [Candidatus Rokubacteria bacterium]